MTTDIEQFQFPVTGQSVRTVTIDGAPWFVSVDVCAVLDIANARQAVSYLDEDEVRRQEPVTTNDGSGRVLPANLINEAGLYSLILRSRKPEAKAFKRWITHEVLPAIRQTGSYGVPSVPAQLSPRELAQLVIAEADRADAAEALVIELAPAAQSWNVLASGDGDYSVGDAAKILSRDPAINVGERRLFTILHEHGWTYRQKGDQKWRAYQKAIDAGRLSEIPQSHYHPRTGELVLDPPQVRVLPKGVNDLRLILGGSVPLAIADSEGL